MDKEQAIDVLVEFIFVEPCIPLYPRKSDNKEELFEFAKQRADELVQIKRALVAFLLTTR